MEANAGGTLIYIRNHLSYKTRNDLQIYKSFELESKFIEICNTKKTNIIIGCIYKHPSMNINEFNDDYLKELLDKLSKENKIIFLLGDFNINLLNYDIHPPTNEFLDSLSSHNFLPHILQPSRVTTNSKTLIDNIFSNMAVPNIISGNLTASISDHLPQFLVAPNIFFNASYPKSNNHERDWSRFDQETFVLDYFSVEWDKVLISPNTNTEKSYKTFLEKFESLLDTYAPLKKLSKNKLKFKDKPWITPVLQKSISIKNQFLSKFIKLKDPNKKEEAHIRYKQYRNLLSTLIKKSKQFYFTRFFQENIKDLKNMWRGIKKIKSSNNSNHTFPTAITHLTLLMPSITTLLKLLKYPIIHQIFQEKIL